MRLRILILFIFLLGNYSIAQLYTFKNFSHKDGLSMANIACEYEARDGSIWLGTDGAGLVKFNGFDFIEYSHSAQDHNHHVTSIIENGDTIFFTSKYQGVFGFYDEKYHQINPNKDSEGDFVKLFFLEGKKIVVTTRGVYILKSGKSEKLFWFKDQSNDLEVNNVILLKSGCILLTSKGNFHCSLKNNRLVPLNYWLHIPKESTEFIEYGYTNGESIFLFDRNLSKSIEVILNSQDAIFKTNIKTLNSPFGKDEHIMAFKKSYNAPSTVILSTKNNIFRPTGKGYEKIAANSDFVLEKCRNILIDRNGDFWVTSTIKGLYKVSLEPFTRIQLHPIFRSATINSIYKSSSNEFVISTMDETTSIGKIINSESLVTKYQFRTNAIAEYQGKIFLATNNGINIYNSKTKNLVSTEFPELKNEKITFLLVHKDILWVGVGSKGLYKYALQDGIKKIDFSTERKFHQFIYTAQISEDHKTIYFGSNNGLIAYDIKENSLRTVKFKRPMGSYIGNSIKDVHGTIWFTSEKGLIGILKNGRQVILDNPSIFPSTLFYTINSDQFGNLIIGTQKGINILNVNEFGSVLNYKSFHGKNGFEGYETHMRSQFQDGNTIYIGTVEGLYLINTAILQSIPLPNKPVIVHLNNKNSKLGKETFHFQFIVNNPKIKSIEYSYKITGYQNEWSEFTSQNQLMLSDLPNGKYTLEVKATYDGILMSKTASSPFIVDLPFWKSKWFVFILLFFIVLLNIYLINKNKTFSSGNLFNSTGTSITYKLTPQILLFGLISNTGIHLICNYIDPLIITSIGFTLACGFILLCLYLLSITIEKMKRGQYYKYLLIIGFITVLGNNMIDGFISELHPFYVIAILLTNSLAPFVFEKIKSVIIYSVIFLLINSIFVLLLDQTFYNKTLFITAMAFGSFLGVMATYLKNDSLERLIFISGVINKGNAPVISFNSEGIMTYVSENISKIIQVDHESLVGQHISYLNNFVPEEGDFRQIDLTRDFEDGKFYLVPMLSSNNEINWIEWSFKSFTENVKVIIGQNVTKRLEIENTYELLIQNAEDLIYQCDPYGNFQFLNNRSFEKLGYTEKELIGTNTLALVTEEYEPEVRAFYRNHFEERKHTTYLEFPINTKKKEVMWVGQYITTLYKPGEKKIISGFLALARDITEKRKQQEIIKQQRDDITASIRYAQKIQYNLLPAKEKIKNSFTESGILYRPKEIVSGDFYWMERIDDITVVAVADCTGHGVPGSFMTLLGSNLLYNSVLQNHNFNPGNILDELDKKMMETLPAESGKDMSDDGMEITICVFNHETNEMSYACAGSRLLIHEFGAFTLYKGDNKHIGIPSNSDFKGYVTHYRKFSPDAIMYLFTDGFQNQFGGIKNKKYSFRRMLELFESNIRLPLVEQQLMFQKEFDNWKNDLPQTDDVTIVILRNLEKLKE